MNFRLNEDQQQLQNAIARILGAEKVHTRLRAVIDGKTAWDKETWQELIEFGLTALIVPEAYEGMDLTMIELAVCAEELSRSGAPVPFLGHALATVALVYGGSEEQKQRLLPKLASGEVVATVAMSDQNRTWGPDEWQMTLSGETISGRKINVPFGDIADLVVVGLEGGQLGVVEDTSAITWESMDGVDTTRPLFAGEFANAKVELLADGPAGAGRMQDAALTLLAADAFAGSDHLLHMTSEYLKMREAFGAKLAEFQGIKHQLANLELNIEPTRGLYWYAAYAFAKLPEKASHAAAIAKAQTAEVFIEAGRACTELHGGIGFTWEYDSHIWLKRAMFDFAWGGTPQSHFVRAADLAGW
jgi:alkylation response protein AidB-like acyl-CoA dehydrogenase